MPCNRNGVLVLVLVSCMLTSSQPALAHSGQHDLRNLLEEQQAVGTVETDAAAAELANSAQAFPPAVTADEAATAAAAAAAAGAPIGRRACGVRDSSRSLRASTERRFQQRLQQLRVRGQVVSVAEVPVIEVYFHVVLLNNAKGIVTQAQIDSQIATLNAAYAGLFTFTLANAAWYSTTSAALFNADTNSAGETSIKQQLRKGTAQTLNIYTWEPKDSTSSTTLGWATFPWSYSRNPRADGVVLLHSAINGGSSVGYNLGDTAVHEVGHWAGLYHTFEGGCGTLDTAKSGDYVADTPAVKQPNFGCVSVNSCIDNQGRDLIQNYMDYTPDACMTSFTAGQRARMQAAWSAWRSSR